MLAVRQSMPAGVVWRMKARPWQIVIIALAFIAVGASAAYMWSQGGGPDIPTRITLIDVTTGQLYEWNMKKYRVSLPAPDPATGEYRLVPVLKKEEGGWELTGNARTMLRGIKSKFAAVDAKTGAIIETSSEIKTYVPPGA